MVLGEIPRKDDRPHLNGARELALESPGRGEGRVEVQEVGDRESSVLPICPMKRFHFPVKAPAVHAPSDDPRRDTPFPIPLKGLLPARERPCELLETDLERSFASVRVLDGTRLRCPLAFPTQGHVLSWRDAHAPRGRDRHRAVGVANRCVDAAEHGPLQRPVDAVREGAAPQPEQIDRVPVERQSTTYGEHLFDVAQPTPNGGREQVDVDARAAGQRGRGLSRRAPLGTGL